MILVKNESKQYDLIKKTISGIKEKYGIEVYDLNSFSYWIKIDTIDIDDDQINSIIRTFINNGIRYKNE